MNGKRLQFSLLLAGAVLWMTGFSPVNPSGDGTEIVVSAPQMKVHLKHRVARGVEAAHVRISFNVRD